MYIHTYVCMYACTIVFIIIRVHEFYTIYYYQLQTLPFLDPQTEVIYPLNMNPLSFKLPCFLVENNIPDSTCTVVTTDLKSISYGRRGINDLIGAFGRKMWLNYSGFPL